MLLVLYQAFIYAILVYVMDGVLSIVMRVCKIMFNRICIQSGYRTFVHS